MLGIPYAYHNEDDSVTCPVCGVHLKERTDRDGEQLTSNYAEHYERHHAHSEETPNA